MVVLVESERDYVVAHVLRPGGHQLTQACQIVRKERARSLFKTGHVSSHGGHEVVSTLLRFAAPVFLTMHTSGSFNQFTHRHRGTAGLCRQPLPVAWQQGYLASHHA